MRLDSWRGAVFALGALFLSGQALAGASEVKRSESFVSRALGHPVTYSIYLPADLDPAIRVPVVYLLHGALASSADWIDSGHLQSVADRLIEEHRIPKMIIVMPDAENSWYVDSPGSGMGAMATALERDLPDWIEAHYPALPARSARAVAGYSMGGFGAFDFAFSHPNRYVAVAALSGAFWTWMKPDATFDAEHLAHLDKLFQGAFGAPFDPKRFVAESPAEAVDRLPGTALRPAVLMICGDHDEFHLDNDQRVMAQHLEAAHIPFEARMIPGGHDWGTWAQALPIVLEFFGKHLHEPVTASAIAPAAGKTR